MCRKHNDVLQTGEEANLVLWWFAHCEDTLYCIPIRLSLNDKRMLTGVPSPGWMTGLLEMTHEPLR